MAKKCRRPTDKEMEKIWKEERAEEHLAWYGEEIRPYVEPRKASYMTLPKRVRDDMKDLEEQVCTFEE